MAARRKRDACDDADDELREVLSFDETPTPKRGHFIKDHADYIIAITIICYYIYIYHIYIYI